MISSAERLGPCGVDTSHPPSTRFGAGTTQGAFVLIRDGGGGYVCGDAVPPRTRPRHPLEVAGHDLNRVAQTVRGGLHAHLAGSLAICRRQPGPLMAP